MGRRKRYLYSLVKPSSREAMVGFHMITSNLSQLLSTLDKIRRKPKKFICLNDNMDASRPEDNQLIQAVLIDFFHSLFPKPSQFELPADYRNRYLYYNDFIVWQSKKKRLSRLLYATIAIAVVFTFGCLFHNECHKLKTRVRKRVYKIISRIKSSRRKLPTKL
ncbi:N-acetylglucosamine-1-phosphotransferase subunits alpha/beta [Homalodisca vitripennis]|uniref:N-acetylglucosamine-1-phosphotransferase subunits alpha/beta n=1 Tax=Homalodisca vitripennis TaxID=197043 RepID=UPI001EEC7669|nr:N-acetylglucosamine-1-phosphotransferase subunits alpha/beta [Homalodisca vitripennis]